MSNWAVQAGGALGLYGATISGAATARTNVNLPNADSAWSQISAAVPFEVHAVLLIGERNNNTNGGRWLGQLGIGGSGSEVVIADKVSFMETGGILVPVRVPSGARLALKGLNPGGFCDYYYTAVLVGQSALVPVSGVLEGCAWVNPSVGSSNTWSAYTQLWASTTRRTSALFVEAQIGSAGSNECIAFEVAVGSAGNEVAIASGLWNAQSIGSGRVGPYRVNIPRGERISIRHRSSGTGGAHTGTYYHVELVGA